MKNFISILFLIQFSISFSQEMFQIEYDFTDHNNYACKSTLYTDNKEAVYSISDFRNGQINMSNGNLGFEYNDALSRFFYTNETSTYYRFSPYGDEIVYKDNYTEKLNWTINNKIKKKIGKYDCTEAKLKINGRSYTVWFTFEVPVKFGPLKLHKLPGLIVEVSEDNGYLKIALSAFSKTKDLLSFNKFKEYYTKPKKIMNYNEYEKFVVDSEISFKLAGLADFKETKTEGNIDDSYALGLYLDLPIKLEDELKRLH